MLVEILKGERKMNKILKRIAGIVSCFAILLVAGISLTACGKKDDPEPPADTTIQVSNQTELTNAFKKGGSIKLTSDITVTENDVFVISKDVTLDLNSHKITGSLNKKLANLFTVKAKLTINATTGGVVLNETDTTAETGGYIFNVGDKETAESTTYVKGELTINGGAYSCVSASAVQVVYGKATINGGKFETSYSDSQYLINRLNSSDVTYNGTFFKNNFTYASDVVIVVNGGTFKGFNPKTANAAAHDPVTGGNGYLGANKTVTAGNGQNGAEAGWFIVK